MYKKPLCLLSIFLTIAPAAMAQQLYKTIGADGKVTFSDRPHLDNQSKLSVMHSYTLRPVEAPKPLPDAAIKPKAPVQRTDTPVVISKEIEDTIVTTMGLSAFGGRFEMFCSDSEAELHAFSGATQAWKTRNVEAVEQQKRVLMLVLAPAKRAELISREETLLAAELAKVSGRTPAARKEWCEGVTVELNSGHSDIASPALMAVPITPFKPK